MKIQPIHWIAVDLAQQGISHQSRGAAGPSGRQPPHRVRRADFDAFLARSQAVGPTPRNTTGKRSSVVVYRGIEAPALQRHVGPFTSRKLALEWLEQEGLGSTPSDAAEWAAVYPVSDQEVK